jgi:hypothetical protein
LRPTPENRATLARARADEDSRRAIDYTAPDPLPKGRGG